MPDSFWNNLPAIIGAIVAALAWFQSLRNGDAARLAAEKAKVAATKTEEVQAALQVNTKITEKVQQQTNGAKERQDAMIDSLIKNVGDNTTAIRLIRQDIAELKEAAARGGAK